MVADAKTTATSPKPVVIGAILFLCLALSAGILAAVASCSFPSKSTSSHTVSLPTRSASALPSVTAKPVTTKPAVAVAPLKAGTYTGRFTVTRDSSRAPQSKGKPDDLTGTHFTRTFSFAKDCDSPSGTCTVSHLSLALYAPEPFKGVWRWTDRGTRSQTAKFTEKGADDCVAVDTDKVVGSFATTVTETITLSRPTRDKAGVLRWGTATVLYVEDAVSKDTDQGCYTSNFEAEGTLVRQIGK